MPTISRNMMLYGTEQDVPPPVVLRAGPLSAELDAGNLRALRWDGVEMLRAVSYVVRDRDWATYNPEISDLNVRQDGQEFRVTYSAVAADAKQRFRWTAEIVGRADGTLRFDAAGIAETGFETNRTGFVVLHPAGVAGAPVAVEHVDGSRRDARFPDLIEPLQPMQELRALTHAFAPGALVECRMEGDIFEMEDQRNWTDASYKTYVRPIGLPWPFLLAAGTELRQSVALAVTQGAAARAGEDAITVSLAGEMGRMPPVGVGLDPDDAPAALAQAARLRAAGLRHLLIHHDPRCFHGRATMAQGLEVAKALGAEPWLEFVVPGVEDFRAHVAAAGADAAALGASFRTVLVSPAADVKGTLPGSPWPPCPPLADVYAAARAAFPGARIGGGTFAFFTELNRKRPPLAPLDLVSFTTSPLVHAGDDRTVMENLETLPYVARSVRAFINDRPFHVGPSAIGMRDNPYGGAPLDNPGNIRQAMSRSDPRQRGLLGAAWYLGHVALFAAGGAGALTLGGAVGAFGLLQEDGGLVPAFHVLRGLAALAGRPLLEVRVSQPTRVQALAVGGSAGTEIWLANLTPQPQPVTLDARLAGAALAALDEQLFEQASQDAASLDRMERRHAGESMALAPFGVVRLRLA
jgi:hypothetical protein